MKKNITIYIRHKFETRWKTVKISHYDRLWDNARYLLEKQAGFHTNTRNSSCYVGLLVNSKIITKGEFDEGQPHSIRNVSKDASREWKEGYQLHDSIVLQNGDQILLRRVQLPHFFRQYVPIKYDTHVNEWEATVKAIQRECHATAQRELDKKYGPGFTLQKVAEVKERVRNVKLPPKPQRAELQHPSNYMKENNEVDVVFVPPATYICSSCGEVGKHFSKECTKRLVENYVPISEQVFAHGIPATFLNEINEKDNDGSKIMLTQSGEKVICSKVNPLNEITFEEIMKCYSTKTKCSFEFEKFLTAFDKAQKKFENHFYRTHPRLRKKGTSCLYGQKGFCKKGALACEFDHTNNLNNRPICKFFLQGACTHGNKCNFRHLNKHT